MVERLFFREDAEFFGAAQGFFRLQPFAVARLEVEQRAHDPEAARLQFVGAAHQVERLAVISLR
ncbi:hypothetical protein D3C83_205590 [compost metagenome]